MKKIIIFALVVSILVSFSPLDTILAEQDQTTFEINNPQLLQYVEDQVYSTLSDTLDSEDYIIEKIQAKYISQEYLDEVAFNSQSNIFFGYTIADLKTEYKDTAYIFTLGDNNQTIVKPFIEYENPYDTVIRNVAIGTGVILVCVTVSVVSGGMGLTTVSMVFAASAKTGTTVALSSGLIGGVAAGAIKGYETGDINEAIKAAAVQGSESFKWGAISGAISGGLSKLRDIHRATKAIGNAQQYFPGEVEIPADAAPWQQAELRALNQYGGYDQLTYLNGEQVPLFTRGGTRPDVIRFLGDHIEAVEVKYYDLQQQGCLSTLYRELQREVRARVLHLPKGSTQRIVLDVTGRGYTESIVEPVVNKILDLMDDIYPNIPIDIVGL